jgi:hypothetical protein
MPRTDNFQGLTSPFFPADPYYFAGNTNPAAKRPARSKTRSSLSSDSAPSQTLLKESSSLTGSKDDSNSQTSPSHARAHSTAASSSPLLDTRKRPSTATSSTSSRDPPSLIHPALSHTDIQQPAIAADDNMDTTNSPPLPDSTTIIPPAMPKFDIKNGKRLHPYPSKNVPYPRSYDSTAIDQSVFMCLCFRF